MNEGLIASASAHGNFYVWDILNERAKAHILLPSHALMMQWSRVNTNKIIMLLATGDVKILNLDELTIKRVASFTEISPTIIQWHPNNVSSLSLEQQTNLGKQIGSVWE